MERAIFDDVRFQTLYEGPVAATFEKPMQYFELRTPDAIADYVEQRYPRFERAVAAPRSMPNRRLMRAVLDVVNGKPAAPPLRIPRMVLSLAGWAHDRAEPGAPTEVFALLTRADSGTRSAQLAPQGQTSQPRSKNHALRCRGTRCKGRSPCCRRESTR